MHQTAKTHPTRRVLAAGILPTIPVAVANQVVARHEHAKKCKHSLFSCGSCKDSMNYFGEMPLPVLSTVLEDPQARKGTFKLAAIVVTNAIERWKTTKRGEADFDAAEKFFALHKKHFPKNYPKH